MPLVELPENLASKGKAISSAASALFKERKALSDQWRKECIRR